jgi:hypothetical protein
VQKVASRVGVVDKLGKIQMPFEAEFVPPHGQLVKMQFFDELKDPFHGPESKPEQKTWTCHHTHDKDNALTRFLKGGFWRGIGPPRPFVSNCATPGGGRGKRAGH